MMLRYLQEQNIGIAMGGLGADAALEAADIILMEDEPLELSMQFVFQKGNAAFCEGEYDICSRK